MSAGAMQETKMTAREASAAMRPILQGLKLEGRTIERPLAATREYRGKRQCVVGYEWTRRYSHFMTGRVYDAILGWGSTFEEAIAKAARRIGA